MLEELVASIRGSHAAVATVLVTGEGSQVEIDGGADPIDADTLFEVGSLTKTMTGTLLAVLACGGQVTLDTTVGDVVDEPGAAARVTLLELATHTSGLPRLAPNHLAYRDDPMDPYARYDESALYESLPQVTLAPAEAPLYSNYGYQLLGHLLARAAGRPFDELVVDDVLRPAGCARPRCGSPHADDDVVPGYSGARAVPRWTEPLAGAGGVLLGIADIGRWLATNLEPSSSALGDAIELAQRAHWGDRMDGRGLGWRHYNGALIQNGETGGYRAFSGLIRGVAAIGVLANMSRWDVMDGAALALLGRLARERDARDTDGAA